MQDINTVTIGEAVYHVGRLNARQALHVSRRLLPFLGSVLPHLKVLLAKDDESQPDGTKWTKIAAVLPDIAEILADMSDEEVDYIMDRCLKVVRRREVDGSWAPIMAPTGTMMYDLNPLIQLQLTGKVVQENLADFFPTAGLKG